LRINRQIRADRVRVIDEEGRQLGVMSIRDALDAAEKAHLDLVEVAPNAEPPVCKITTANCAMSSPRRKKRVARRSM
jgi:translation initiation factor IF-3